MNLQVQSTSTSTDSCTFIRGTTHKVHGLIRQCNLPPVSQCRHLLLSKKREAFGGSLSYSGSSLFSHDVSANQCGFILKHVMSKVTGVLSALYSSMYFVLDLHERTSQVLVVFDPRRLLGFLPLRRTGH